MGVCTSGNWQTPGRLVQELNVCTVDIKTKYPFNPLGVLSRKLFLSVKRCIISERQQTTQAIHLFVFNSIRMCVIVSILSSIFDPKRLVINAILYHILKQLTRETFPLFFILPFNHHTDYCVMQVIFH